jgi:hypothetical protein
VASSASTARNHVASESAFTATVTSTRSLCSSIADRASRSSRLTCRPSRTSAAPAAVGSQGVARRTRTWPTWASSARTRWLTALGVTCSARAAASKLPWSAMATSASTAAGWYLIEGMLMNVKKHSLVLGGSHS